MAIGVGSVCVGAGGGGGGGGGVMKPALPLGLSVRSSV